MKIEAFADLVAEGKAAGKRYELGRALRKGAVASLLKKRPKQVVADDLVALFEKHNGMGLTKQEPMPFGRLCLHPMSK